VKESDKFFENAGKFKYLGMTATGQNLQGN
jgi:hypothetical protein